MEEPEPMAVMVMMVPTEWMVYRLIQAVFLFQVTDRTEQMANTAAVVAVAEAVVHTVVH